MIEEDIEAIESGYEFLLAFAAQGRPAQNETGPGPHARPTIEGIAAAMNNIATALSDSKDDFEQVIANDCRNAGAALAFILAQEKIGSEIVDNLNASIHLRAVLTDLFLYSEALKPLDTGEAVAPSAAGGVETYDATQK
ncbi:MAG: hypothetical protein HN872_00260 [Gammaproteobacteria bacterium]|nr:hypothetical protein [Pseudomonadales bacterium]MBT7225018.1 hypothetical protein [Gammaproteobacteria bacterium]MDB3908531.1 hypothetical protein [Gammaproteobacteria bacterium]